MVGLPEWADIANRNVVTALIARKIQPDGYVLPAFAAVEIATAAVAEASASGRPLETILTSGEFATVLGTISFDAKGDLSKNPYGVFRFDGAEFTPVDVE
jgi:branched-chain amino acid transport system substrate-binding protein